MVDYNERPRSDYGEGNDSALSRSLPNLTDEPDHTFGIYGPEENCSEGAEALGQFSNLWD